MKYFKLIFRNVGRNRLRSLLASLVTIILVFVVTMVWSILWLLDLVTAEKSQNFRAMVTERWAVPSRLPYAYAAPLGRGAARNPGDVRPLDSMTWQFYIGTLDPATAARVYVRPLPSRKCDQTNWWKSRGGFRRCHSRRPRRHLRDPWR